MAGIKQALPIKENELNAGLVFDMVYNPLSTPRLKLAHSRGIPIISWLLNVCAARRLAVRNLDRKTRPRSLNAARR